MKLSNAFINFMSILAPTTSRQSDWRKRDPVNDELRGMMGTRDFNYDRKKSPSPGPWETGPRSPEKRTRSASPTPGTSMSADIKGDKGEIFFFCRA